MYSFDVFDTLITRNTAAPEGIFLLMQRYLEEDKAAQSFPDGLVGDFPVLRVDAERNARRFHPKREIQLKDIYDVMAQSVSLSPEDKAFLMELEEHCETACVVGLEDNIDQLKELLSKGKKVILLSDMYLPAAVIRRMLLKVDTVFDKVPLYVSCEYGVTKNSGLLYVLVHEKERVEYSQWVHYGDNEISDVNVPRLYGIRAKKVPSPGFQPWERAMADWFHLETDLMLQFALGVSRKLCGKEKNEAFRVGASCASLILIPYVIWVIRRALELHITRLYFIARDGYLLKKIADIYIEKTHLEIETKYLYGSRQAWEWKNEAEKEILLQYLRQEITVPESSFALVDTHGTGKSVSRIAGLLGMKMTVFYYVLLESPQGKNCDFHVYSADAYNGIIEALCRAPHGVTLGYANKGGAVVPRLSDSQDKLWDVCGLSEYIRGLEMFEREMLSVCQKLHVNPELKAIGKRMLRYCAETPDGIVAGVIGDMPHDGENRESGWKYAPRLNSKDIYRLAFKRTSQDLEKFYKGDDIQYSYRRLTERDKNLYDKYERYYRGVPGEIMHLPYKKAEEVLKRKKRIKVILYAAGKYGKELYHRMRYAEGIDIVCWVDVNYRIYREKGYPVSPIAEIRKRRYDRIVISLDSVPVSETVRDMLVSVGVRKEKILLRDEFVEKYL